jgi:glycerol-3-phosphate acyltransferase PlsY
MRVGAMLQSAVFWTVVGFALGSIPFSYWLGRSALRTDIRDYGDGNPGSANAWRAGTWRLGIPALLLDYLKGAIPVSLASHRYGVSGWALVPAALAPVLGHAFSPFLRLRGGKAIASTFGIWTALTLWAGPTVLGLSVGLFRQLQVVDGWTVMLGMTTWLGCLLLSGAGTPPLLAVWCGNLAVLVWTHRQELRRPPQLRPWLRRLLQRLGAFLARGRGT